tara:strand:+ start:137 stop:427 length:291 start_codon:yes stop_codon:yes gene_type:complete
MSNSNKDQSIVESLSIIRNALNDKSTITEDDKKDFLLLNQLVKKDGTILSIDDNNLRKDEIKKILDNKLNEVFDNHLEDWLNKNLPNYIDKYFSKK